MPISNPEVEAGDKTDGIIGYMHVAYPVEGLHFAQVLASGSFIEHKMA